MSLASVDPYYRRAVGFLDACDWPAAEGVLLQLRHRVGVADLSVADALAYALLMQGAYGACAQVLEPVLDHPQRSFWIAHKYADARRGLHDPEGAVHFYRQALREGSTSALTSRNLLQVLYGQSPELAVAELDQWGLPLEPHRLEGVQAAAALVVGAELMEWLHRRDLTTPLLQRRLAEQRLYSLEWPGDLLTREGSLDGQRSWCEALRWRLGGLNLAHPSTRSARP